MNLSKREQIYAIVTAIVLLAGLAYYFLVSPYLASLARLTANIKTAQTKYDRELKLLKAQPKVAADWETILAAAGETGGVLKTIPAEASGQAREAINVAAYNASAYNASFNLQGFSSDRPRQEGDFQIIRMNVTGTAPTIALYRFVSAIEQSPLPLRIEDLRVTARQPGTNDLNVALTISTIIFVPNTTPSRSTPQPQPQGDSL